MSSDVQQAQCPNCGHLREQLNEQVQKNTELEQLNDNLTKEIEGLLESQEKAQKQINELLADQKKQTMSQFSLGLSTLTQSQDLFSSNVEDTTPGSGNVNLKKIQQELRVSKKAEQLAKEKLAQAKKSLERTEKDFGKYKQDSEARIESLKNEILILQRHYDQLQNSINESELERSNQNSNSGKDQGSELVKIIEDYSRQNEQKGKEIEALIAKIDKKQLKMDDLKKHKTESDAKLIKLRSTLDNVKTFLRLLSTNYMKSMKVQSSMLKDSFNTSTEEFIKEIQTLKQDIEPKVKKIVLRQSKDILDKLSKESEKSKMLENSLHSLKQDHQTQLNNLIEKHTQEILQVKEKSGSKISSLKEKVKSLSNQQQNDDSQRNQIKDQLTSRITQLERDLDLQNVKLESEKDKFQIQLSELKKELSQKDQVITDLREKEQLQTKKFEEFDNRHRQEVQKLNEKFENDKMTWIQREADMSGAREAERLKEVKELYETKSRDKEEEIQRLRLVLAKNEQEISSLKQDQYKTSDTIMSEKRELEKEKLLLQAQVQEFEKRINLLDQDAKKYQQASKERKIELNKLSKKSASDEQKIQELTFNLNSQQEENSNLKKENLNLKLAQEDVNNISQLKQLKIENLENQLDQVKFDLHDEIKDKEHTIESLQQQLESLNKKLIIAQEEANILSNQISLASQSSQQSVEVPKAKKKKIIKKKKTFEVEVQTEQEITVETTLAFDFDLVQFDLKPLVKPQQVQSEIVKDQDQAPKPDSPLIRGQHIEEDSYVQERIEDSAERRTQPIIDLPDMAMRGPGQGAPRFNAPRPNQPMNRGRGMPPGFQARPQMPPAGRGGPAAQQFMPRPQIQQQVDQQLPEVNEETKQNIAQVQNQTQEEQKSLQLLDNQNQVKEQVIEQRPRTQQFMQPPALQQPKQEEQQLQIQQQVQEEPQLTQRAQVQNDNIQEEKNDSKEEEKKSAPLLGTNNQQANNNQTSILDLRNNRFFGMINGFIGFLTRRKGYTGRPASAMKWDEVKKRYVIEGEEESDDDIPPPPPPKFKKKEEEQQLNTSSVAQSQTSDMIKSSVQEATSSSDLTRPALPAHMANRGRGRGRGSQITANRFPQTFGAGQLTETKLEKTPQDNLTSQNQSIVEEVKSETQNQNVQDEIRQSTQQLQEEAREEVSQLYTTSLDITMNQTQIMQEQVRQSQNLPIQKQQPEFDEAREQMWQDRFSSQQEKINNLKYKVSILNQELRMQREENEQTIENFTILCQDLKFKGLDEVEDLQSEISILKDDQRKSTQIRAELEVKSTQLQDSLSYYEKENDEIRDNYESMMTKLFDTQVELEIVKQQLASKAIERSEQEEDSQVKVILDLQQENSQLKWQKSIIEAEKLTKVFELKQSQHAQDSLKQKITQLEQDKLNISEEQKKHFNDIQAQHQEQIIKLEKEKDSIREMINKVQLEKERQQEQNRERFSVYELKIKQGEEIKQRHDQEIAKVSREKEVVIEQLKNKNLHLTQTIQQKETEIGFQKDQITQYQQKIQSLIQKRQIESEQADNMMKSQLKQIQNLLQQKTQELQQYEYKQDEYNQELQNMDAIRHKLTENIVYLQNEIRKRDELLEQSEFGDFDMIGDESDSVIAPEDESVRGLDLHSNRGDEDANAGTGTNHSVKHSQYVNIKRKRKTFGQQLQNQLDDTRNQLKQQIEERMRAQRSYQNLERNYLKIVEGLNDISGILEQQHQNCGISSVNNEQSSSLFQEEESKSTQNDLNSSSIRDDSLIMRGAQMDELQQQIISKIFSISRHYESELSEQQHKFKLIQMKLEESENLKFDIEILTEEKALNESELNQLRGIIRDLEHKLQELKSLQTQQSRVEEGLIKQMESMKNSYEQQKHSDRIEHQNQINQLMQENQKKIDEIHETFKSQILPEIKQKHQSKYQSLKDQITQVRNDLSMQLEDQKKLNQTLEHENKSILNQSIVQLESENEEKERIKERINFIEIQKQELENQVQSQKTTYEKQVADLLQEIQAQKQEHEVQEKQFNEYKENLETYFREAAMKLKQKIDEKKKLIKDMQTKFKEQMQLAITNHQQEITNLVKSRDEQEKHLQQQLIKQINDLTKNINDDQIQIEQLKAQNESLKQSQESDQNAKQQLLQLQNERDLKDANFKQELEALKSTQQQEISKLNETIEQLQNQDQNEAQKQDQSEIVEKVQQLTLQINENQNLISHLRAQLEQKDQEILDVQQQALKQSQSVPDIDNQNEVNQELQNKIIELESLVNTQKTDLENLEVQKQMEVENLQNITRTVKSQMIEENQKLREEIEKLKSEDKKLSQSQPPKQQEEEKKDHEEEVQQQNDQIQESVPDKNQEILQQNQNLIDELYNEKVKSVSLENEIKTLQEQIEELKANPIEPSNTSDKIYSQTQLDMQIQILESEWETKLSQKDEEFQKEKKDMVDYFDSREIELKSLAEQVAIKLKGDLKKQKEKVKSALTMLEQTQNERDDLQTKISDIQKVNDELQTKVSDYSKDDQISELKLRNSEIQEALDLEISKVNALSEENQSLLQITEDLKLQVKTRIEELTGIIQGLDITLVDTHQNTEEAWNQVIEKIREILQNYEEDKRSLRTLINEKEELAHLKEMYYQEKESLYQEKSILEDKLQNSNAFKLQQRVQMLEEERSEMRNDFYIKIESFVKENDDLKSKLSRYEEPIPEQEKSQSDSSSSNITRDKNRSQLQNQTFMSEIQNASQRQEHKDPSFMDQSKTSMIQTSQAQIRTEQEELRDQQQKSGIFSSIASFFLTDSELDN